MGNVFDRLAAVSRQTVERVHGKAVTIYPVGGGSVNAAPAVALADPAAWETSAVFFENTMMESDRRAQPSADGRRIMHRALQAQASIRLIDGKALKAGFLMRRHEDDAWYSISSFDPDGLGTVLAVVALAKPQIVVDEEP
ncbi:hypothetical protein LAC81_15075 [Ensifer adhaerens]|uniref:hypothetical protein n=1 Tax=Ensifer adhaerens TaxID=106592 RepID=UPI001CBEBC7A|nr:hypothetical protein [Ensifer adhaerens]MBZ7923112.1 hypothetical protein [Ensifer adhaerens]UAX91702.1 hypothetical protein LAC78_15070 [Ensifer adhaerens]UAX99330.1 hypothetical protein LAC80_15075 [Ensifer adhaerens]UAY06713.1 hypothetical protein LAC81_15075 [Ensifer adhaerens]